MKIDLKQGLRELLEVFGGIFGDKFKNFDEAINNHTITIYHKLLEDTHPTLISKK